MEKAKAVKVGTERRLVEDNWTAFVRCRDNGHRDYVERAKKMNAYYLGDQWEESTLAELRAANRPAQTINLVMSTVNAVLGEQINSRQEITFKPASTDANADDDAEG